MQRRRFLVGTLFSASVLLGIAGWTRSASGKGFFNIYTPGQLQVALDHPRPVPVGLLLYDFDAPSGRIGSSYQPTERVVTHPAAIPVGQLANPPAELAASINVSLADATSLANYHSDTSIGWYKLASIKYAGSGGFLFVTTSRPTVKANERTLYLGTPTTLADGTPAWLSYGGTPIGNTGKTLTQVLVTRGDVLVAVIGTQSVDELKVLAADLVVRGNQV